MKKIEEASRQFLDMEKKKKEIAHAGNHNIYIFRIYLPQKEFIYPKKKFLWNEYLLKPHTMTVSVSVE